MKWDFRELTNLYYCGTNGIKKVIKDMEKMIILKVANAN